MNKIVLLIVLVGVSACLARPQTEKESSNSEESGTSKFFKDLGEGAKKAGTYIKEGAEKAATSVSEGAKKAATTVKDGVLKGYDYLKEKLGGSKSSGEIDVRGATDHPSVPGSVVPLADFNDNKDFVFKDRPFQ